MNYTALSIEQLKMLNTSTLTKKEFYQLSLNKNIQYYKFLDDDKVYIKLVNCNDSLTINIKRT